MSVRPETIANRPEETSLLAKDGRLAYRMLDLVKMTGLSRRVIERERSAGRFPAPDKLVGRVPLWRCSTVDAWLASGNRV